MVVVGDRWGEKKVSALCGDFVGSQLVMVRPCFANICQRWSAFEPFRWLVLNMLVGQGTCITPFGVHC